MKANVLVGVGFILLAVLLGILSHKKILGDGWLDRADKIASITSLAIALVAFVNPFEGGANLSRPQNNATISGGSGNTIAQGGDNSTINVGDTTTTAEKRWVEALERVKSELIGNFRNLALQIKTLETQPPKAFWDLRRPNETEAAYQDRAKNEFRDYERFIQSLNSQVKFSGSLTATFQKDLAFKPRVAEQVTQAYDQQEETRDTFASLESGLHHLLGLNLTDGERTSQAQSLHREKLANAKMALANAASYFCLIAADEDMGLLMDSFSTLGIDAQFQRGDSGYKTAKRLAAKFAQEKSAVLQGRLPAQTQASQREIDRRINDPYLLMLRKTTRLPPTLTEAEVIALQGRTINQSETEPVELFRLAASSYLESDGRASAIYFRRALDTRKLTPIQSQFAQVSIDRLENPERYAGSLGVMVIQLSPGGGFEQAGLKVGDVIVSFEKEVINEPMDIASSLAKAGKTMIPLTVVRNGQKQIVNVQGGQSASAALTQLIILNAIQL